MQMRPRSIIRLLESLDAFRRPERLQQFVQACEADARGRLGLEDRNYPNGEYLLGCCEAGVSVETKPLIDAGHEGKKLAEQIRHARIKSITQYIDTLARR